MAIKQVSIKQSDGTYSSYDIGANANNIYIDENHTLADKAPIWDNGGGGGGGDENPDGTAVINRNSDGDITSIVLTYSGGVKTTTFSENNGTKTIIERDVKTGASTATVKTITITNSQITQVTTEVPVTE